MKLRLPLISLILLFTFLSAYYIRDYLSQILFIPIINLAHLLWLILAALPEIFWWVLMILGLVIFILKVVSLGVDSKPERKKEKTHPPGLVSDWNRMIDQAKKGNYSRWLLGKKSSNLVLAILAYKHRLTVDQVKNMIISQDLQLPEHIRAYLLQGIHSPSFQHFLEVEQKHQPKINDQSIEMEIDNLLNYLDTEIT